jgi:hypothetical protein
MKIEKEIQDLLYRNDCVIVPSFGAFIGTRKSAQLLENQNFIPPKKNISFNSQIVSNDGLLASYIAVNRSISYQEALQIIEESVNIWQNKLNLIKKVYLSKIGTLILNEDHILSFLPEETENFLTTSFGLSPIISPNIEKNEDKAEVNQIIVENKTSKTLNIEQKETVTKSIKRKNNLLKIAAIFLIFFGISSIIGLFIYNQNIENKSIAIEKRVNEKLEKKISEATFVLPIISFNDFNNNTKITGLYYVVAGSFSKIDNAKKLQLQLIHKGFQSKIITRSNNMYSVTYTSFTTEIEAENYKINIQKDNNPDAWVLLEPK